MKKFVSLLLVLSVLASVCLIPVQAAGETVSDEMKMTTVTLRTQEGKEGIYYGASFTPSDATVDAMAAANDAFYGIALTTTYLPDPADWTAGLQKQEGAATVLCSTYTNALTAGTTTPIRSTSLVNIININNDTLTNKRNASTQIYVRPYICIDGVYTYGTEAHCSMQAVAEAIDAYFDGSAPEKTLSDSEMKSLLGMYERFNSLMNTWDMERLSDQYYGNEAKNISPNELILEYRRDKVVANMKAQTEVVWSIETADGMPLQYSRAPKSSGIADDSKDVVCTLYPGRTYVGIPYTHGSSSLDMFLARATLKDGVYVIENANSSLFSGGSKNENEANSAFNVSRLGNDCWDAISWAYETVGSSVLADQTSQLVKEYGMFPVGEYDITPALTSKGLIDDPAAIHTALKASGELQVMYRSYAAMQPGDTLVNKTHSLMVTGVNIVKNTDGTINPTASTVTFMEQGSGQELAQSAEFEVDNWVDQAAAHKNDHKENNPGNRATCKQCYDMVILDKSKPNYYHLSNGEITWTFQKTFSEHHYIPVAPKELTDASFKPVAARVTDNKSNTLANLFTGTLTSTYRVSKVTLDIFDGNGENVNTSTILGIQNGVDSVNVGLSISRFLTDQTKGAYGSVVVGAPALVKQTHTETVYEYTESAEGTFYYDEETSTYVEVTEDTPAPDGAALYTKTEKEVSTSWLEAPGLAEGEYSYAMSCTLGNGRVITFRTGFFTVELGTNANSEADAHLVSAS